MLTSDRGIAGIKKRIKIVLFKSQNISSKFLKSVVPKSKNDMQKASYWKHTIPLKNVGLYYLRDGLLLDLTSIYEAVFRMLSKKSVLFWNYDESFDTGYIANFSVDKSKDLVNTIVENPEKIISSLESTKKEIKNLVNNSINKCNEQFTDACEKVGTVELKKSKYSTRKLNNRFDSVQSKFNRVIKDWNNTLFALGEDWELNYDLHSSRYSAIESYFRFEKSLSIKNRIQVNPQFKEMYDSLNFILEKLRQPATDLQKIERVLTFLKENLKKILLSSVIPNLINIISDLKLPEMIDDTVSEIGNKINKIPEKRAFVKTITYDKRIKTSDIDDINPREIISFNALPKLAESLRAIKSEIINKLKEIQSELINLGNMADFSLESAINAVLVENLSQTESKEIALEGVAISLDKKEKLEESFRDSINNALVEIRRSIAEFNDEMYSFTESSKIVDIRLQLAKTKTKAKAKETRDKLLTRGKTFVPVAYSQIKKYYKQGFRIYTDTRKQFGLIETKESITSEVSDFLSETTTAVEKLPYIYRRLFQISPLENERLYVARQQEEKQLEIAYKKWLQGGYAPVIISAEKGGGITSFLNISLSRLDGKIIINRRSVKPTISTASEILRLFEEIFNVEKFANSEDLINYLNNDVSSQMIVIENLQHMYLRTLKGFDGLKFLTRIIPRTSKNIFWITSSTLYASDLLNKIIRLDDIFGYQISLQPFQTNQITQLIKKRNSISGYNLEYEPDPSFLRKKEFDRLPFEQQQKLLEQDFFSAMNKFAQSNVSLSLLFWLRAINEIQERKVCINADFNISDSILKSLSKEKLFVLQSLILHDGLKADDLARTTNFSPAEATQLLQILFDDGVLVKNEDVYLINPFLYRQSVTILKTKNLI
jgi:hypothetical protein